MLKSYSYTVIIHYTSVGQNSKWLHFKILNHFQGDWNVEIWP